MDTREIESMADRFQAGKPRLLVPSAQTRHVEYVNDDGEADAFEAPMWDAETVDNVEEAVKSCPGWAKVPKGDGDDDGEALAFYGIPVKIPKAVFRINADAIEADEVWDVKYERDVANPSNLPEEAAGLLIRPIYEV